MPTQTDFAKALAVLHDGGVDFIIVGGVAAILNGLGYTTYDLDRISLGGMAGNHPITR